MTSSNACELEGLKRVVEFLTTTNQLNLATLITDRHVGIRAYIRDHLMVNNPNSAELQHYFDGWHLGKSEKFSI